MKDVLTPLKAVSEEIRIRILLLLLDREACVCELVEPLDRSQPTVSHHLKILADAGLIAGEKRGRWVWYRPVPERLALLPAGAMGK